MSEMDPKLKAELAAHAADFLKNAFGGPVEALRPEFQHVVGAEVAERDTWPERQGIPTLRRVLESLEFVYHGMSPKSPRQMAALEEIVTARQCVEKAIDRLERK